MKSLFSLLLIMLLPLTTLAYIPRANTIIKKMSSNNGRLEYQVVREVTLESKERRIKAKEVWTIAHGDRMKVEVTSLDSETPWNFAILYSAKQRQTLSRSKALKSFRKSPDFFEPLFHDRSSRSLTKRLIEYRFIPSWITDAVPPTYTDGETKMTPEPFISLAPMEGTVNYAMGASSNSAGGNNQTRLWVEQDSFNIRKGRLRSNAEFVNTQFQRFTGGLKLPTTQQISWDDKTARVKLLSAKRTRTKKNDWALNKEDSGSIPTDPLIKEFYSRFR